MCFPSARARKSADEKRKSEKRQNHQKRRAGQSGTEEEGTDQEFELTTNCARDVIPSHLSLSHPVKMLLMLKNLQQETFHMEVELTITVRNCLFVRSHRFLLRSW